MGTAAVGFRVKSGWAASALLEGPQASPRLVDRRRVDLADPAVPESLQPYHAALGTHRAAGEEEAARLALIARRFGTKSVKALLEEYRTRCGELREVGIVVGSVVDPATIPNQHIRAHAEEGRLFRSVVQEAAAELGFEPVIVLEKELMGNATQSLDRSEQQIKVALTALGRGVGGGWKAEDKSAALAAWIALG